MENDNEHLGIIAVNYDKEYLKIKTLLKYWKILNSFFKYSISSIIAAFIDIIFFELFLHIKINISNKIMFATTLARIISSITNYTLSKKIAFKDKSNVLKTIIKYYTIAIIQMIMSGLAVTLICNLTNISEVFTKVTIDTCLFFIGYKIQRKWVFKTKSGSEIK